VNVRAGLRHGLALSVLAWLALLAACHAAQVEEPLEPAARLMSLDGARWTWLSAQCVDGAIDLNQIGFERTLTSEVRGSRIRLTYDTVLSDPACVSTEVWTLTPLPPQQWRFTPEAHVALPVSVACGPIDREARPGMLRLAGDTLEELVFGSAWCRGFDARFTYRRAATEPLDMNASVRRYVAHWNRRDASAVSSLFASEGWLIEPFTRSSDGLPVRHEGRAEIEAWLIEAFASTPWLALQLDTLDARADNQAIAGWRYMDARLAEPLAGRNLFLMAGGEIFATELQLLGPPVEREPATP
jgi:hypothetical protein